MDWDDESANEHAVSHAPFAARKPGSVIDDGDALDLYVRQIARNLNDLEELVLQLREACTEHAKLLSETK